MRAGLRVQPMAEKRNQLQTCSLVAADGRKVYANDQTAKLRQIRKNRRLSAALRFERRMYTPSARYIPVTRNDNRASIKIESRTSKY